MKQRISACVIAKNEAANIGRWLASVQPIADVSVKLKLSSAPKAVRVIALDGTALTAGISYENGTLTLQLPELPLYCVAEIDR